MVDPAYLVGTGGALGALLRYGVTEVVELEAFPIGTLTVNVLGSFVLAAVTFLGVESDLLLFVGTGACGAFTTFSSFAVDTVRLVDQDRLASAVGNALANLLGAGAAIGLAWLLVRLV